MYAIHELSSAVRTRRREMGLSQQALAKLSGLSRSTVNQLEKATVKDLSLSRTAALLEALGLGLTIDPSHPRLRDSDQSPLELAARTASVSFRTPLTPSALADSLSSGIVALSLAPQIATFLDELPLALMARAVEQVHLEQRLPREVIWANMRRMAAQLKATREIWHAA